MTDVFCNNCGHRNPLGSNFCSSCGAVLETQAPESTTITFHPTAPSDPVEEELAVELGEFPEDVGVLVVKRGPAAGSRFALDKPIVTAGRHPDSDIFLDDITVSRRHAEISRGVEGYTVRDVGSLNGTYVNRQRIDSPVPLRNGDEVQIGKFKLVFFMGAGPTETDG
ncbi:FHA domain-containing protein [Rhabdothermincola sediminis]|uniref:FHA domain-containing protein n=1 Tax=Rhabdothermincola sediminis TaxID=2751370 RepID=UPI001AA072D9|nr:FHA domain-containing protein [Rhabdothermincola sediminis]